MSISIQPCDPAPSFSARPSVLRSGVSLLKLNKWKLPQCRFLWLDMDSKELRWSKNSRLAGVSYKRLPFSQVQKVSKLSKYRQGRAEHGFTLDTASKSLVFRTETVELRDRLVGTLTELTKEAESSALIMIPVSGEDTENCATPETKKDDSAPISVLNEFNKHEGLVCSRELFSKTGSAHKKGKYPEAAYRNILSQICQAVAEPGEKASGSPQFDDLPEVISRLIETQNVHIKKLEDDLQHEAEEKSKIQSLRKRLKMLEVNREQYDTLEKENEELKQKYAGQVLLTQKLEQQLDSPNVDETSSTPFWAHGSQEDLISANLDLLKKGFHGFICCFADEVVSKQICLSPKRGGEDPSFKRRHIFCSQDLAQLIWKPVSLFTSRRVFICTSEINSVLSGTEDPAALQPFPDCEYLTVFSPQITLVIAVERQYQFYLEGIKAMFARSNGFPYTLQNKDEGILTKYKIACQQYDAQARQLERQVKRYKTTLAESICSLDNGLTAQQTVYQAEIEQLREMNEKCVLGLLSPEADEYLKSERVELLDRLKTLNELVTSLQPNPRGKA